MAGGPLPPPSRILFSLLHSTKYFSFGYATCAYQGFLLPEPPLHSRVLWEVGGGAGALLPPQELCWEDSRESWRRLSLGVSAFLSFWEEWCDETGRTLGQEGVGYSPGEEHTCQSSHRA